MPSFPPASLALSQETSLACLACPVYQAFLVERCLEAVQHLVAAHLVSAEGPSIGKPAFLPVVSSGLQPPSAVPAA